MAAPVCAPVSELTVAGSRRRVLAVHPFPDLYGSDRMFLESLRALREHGDEVVAVFPEQGPMLDLVRALGVQIEIVPFPVLRKSALRPFGVLSLGMRAGLDMRHIREFIRAVRPDLAYVNTLTVPHWLLAARSQHVPVLCHVHEAEHQLPTPLAMALVAPLRLADSVIVNSQATGDFVRRLAPSVATRMRVVVNGFDLPERCEPPEGGPTRLLVVGRLSPRKGQDVAIAALGNLVAEGHDVELQLVGGAFRGYEWFEERLWILTRLLGLDARVHFSGFCPSVERAYRQAHVVLVPSRVEPFGNVAVEAMATGRPVVASRVGGLPEIVEHGITGLLCAADDPGHLATAVRELLCDPARARALGQRGADLAPARFGRARFGRAVLDAVGALPPRPTARTAA